MQRLHLVLHQRDQGRDDEGGAGEHEGGELEDQGLSGARGHDDDGVASVEDLGDGLVLPVSEGVEPEMPPESREDVLFRDHFKVVYHRGGGFGNAIIHAMKKWTVATFQAAKGKQKLGCCTAYDACFARLADEAGVPCILVGDSMGMTMLGYGTTLPVKMEETLSATGAVARAVKDAMVVADLPFGSYQCGDDLAMANAVACLKAGADAVKLEGGARVCGLIKRMTAAGIPVLAHVGMTPQSVNAYGGFKTQGKTRHGGCSGRRRPSRRRARAR